ncbi:MAG TPA: neutral zinc metallopeptidase, partial [Gemmatimonadales bacterium]|nr:neutral zinc metallopeptidase [Gemmatimonadales bacterium]
ATMRWTPGGVSDNIEDRRGASGGAGLRLPGGRFGLGTVVILLVLSLLFKRNLFTLLDTGAAGGDAPSGPVQSSAQEDSLVLFVSVVLDSAQADWARRVESAGRTYRPAHLVLFRDAVASACGRAESSSGPFYCPGDEKVYIDLGFYQELRDRFGAPGDFAQAYVLAHEIGHHIQNLLGTEAQVRRLQRGAPGQENDLSVRLELQADCYAGVWAHDADRAGMLEGGDVEEGLAAAAAVGDDRLQRQAGQTVNPDAFTHGTSAQRMEWFQRGYREGEVGKCDTFER